MAGTLFASPAVSLSVTVEDAGRVYSIEQDIFRIAQDVRFLPFICCPVIARAAPPTTGLFTMGSPFRRRSGDLSRCEPGFSWRPR